MRGEVRAHKLSELLNHLGRRARSVFEIDADVVHANAPQGAEVLDETAVAGLEAQEDGRGRSIEIFRRIDVEGLGKGLEALVQRVRRPRDRLQSARCRPSLRPLSFKAHIQLHSVPLPG